MERFEDNPLYVASPSVWSYIVPVLLVCLTFVAFLFDLHYIPLSILALISIGSVLSGHLSILVYSDRFNFRYQNLFGKLMEINNEFYYKDIRKFESNIDKWNPDLSESVVIIFAEELLGGNWLRHIRRTPKIEISMSVNEMSGTDEKYQFELIPVSNQVIKAMRLIHQNLV